MPRAAALIIAAIGAVSGLAPASALGAGDGDQRGQVARIDWSELRHQSHADGRSAVARRIVLNANRYALLTWFPDSFGDQTGRYLDLGGVGEAQIRPVASEALALSTSLATGAYDAEITGASRAEATRLAVQLTASVADAHRANGGGWGDEWQSALWAYYDGLAAWLIWDELPLDDREQVERMIEHEADRFLGYEVPYYRDADGEVVYPGDSKAEENAWNANLLQLATAMLPDARHRQGWMEKNLELMISAFSRPADLESGEIVNGRRLREWLAGSNIADDGTLVNHGFIHPDYMATVIHNTNAVLAYGLAGDPTPAAALHNADLVYEALVEHEFPSPPYRAPGGTIFTDGSPDLYYPEGNDWGTHRRMHFALFDAHASLLGFDWRASTPGAAWERLHAGMVLEMQSRFDDGRTYGDTSEDTYAGREQWVAVHAAQAWLTRWLANRGAIRVTNRPYVAGRVQVEGPRYLAPGDSATATVTFRADALGGARDVDLSLQVPEGWTATADGPTTTRRVRPDDTFVARWQLEPAPDSESGPASVTARGHWVAIGDRRTGGESTTITVAPTPPAGATYLSDHEWVEASNGYDSIRRDVNFYGDPLTVEDEVFEHGFWTNAPSSMTFYLGGRCSQFTAAVGIDDAIAAYGAERGSVEFQVFSDGTKVYDSGLVRGNTVAPPVDVALAGVRELRLVATDGDIDGKSYDHADWVDPVLTCATG